MTLRLLSLSDDSSTAGQKGLTISVQSACFTFCRVGGITFWHRARSALRPPLAASPVTRPELRPS